MAASLVITENTISRLMASLVACANAQDMEHLWYSVWLLPFSIFWLATLNRPDSATPPRTFLCPQFWLHRMLPAVGDALKAKRIGSVVPDFAFATLLGNSALFSAARGVETVDLIIEIKPIPEGTILMSIFQKTESQIFNQAKHGFSQQAHTPHASAQEEIQGLVAVGNFWRAYKFWPDLLSPFPSRLDTEERKSSCKATGVFALWDINEGRITDAFKAFLGHLSGLDTVGLEVLDNNWGFLAPASPTVLVYEDHKLPIRWPDANQIGPPQPEPYDDLRVVPPGVAPSAEADRPPSNIASPAVALSSEADRPPSSVALRALTPSDQDMSGDDGGSETAPIAPRKLSFGVLHRLPHCNTCTCPHEEPEAAGPDPFIVSGQDHNGGDINVMDTTLDNEEDL